ncbi:MAG: hypothetical protein GY903_23240 [Fuerstiella sp.]|nr:hypothetical protein [Fuerstiella sp.]MCP4857409.1 hypothetical protein [Fuerstiella sp.]
MNRICVGQASFVLSQRLCPAECLQDTPVNAAQGTEELSRSCSQMPSFADDDERNGGADSRESASNDGCGG